MVKRDQALGYIGKDIADIRVAIRRGNPWVGRPFKSPVDIEVENGRVRTVGRPL